jgi:hypothetical protein
MYKLRDSVVGIATRYWLNNTGIESRWVEIFRDVLAAPRSPSNTGLRMGINCTFTSPLCLYGHDVG